MSTTRKTSVWIVEDNHKLRRDLVELIDSEPDMECALDVSCCEDALSALDGLRNPDLVFMDLGLPGMSGIEGTDRLRSLSPQTRVVVLTVHDDDDNVFAAACAGASGYLLKPSRADEIVEAVREIERGAAPINGHIASRMLTLFSRLAPPQRGEDFGLTTREREVLELLVEGLTLQQIAERLGVSFHTIDTHQRNIYGKLHVHSRSSAVAKAVRHQLL